MDNAMDVASTSHTDDELDRLTQCDNTTSYDDDDDDDNDAEDEDENTSGTLGLGTMQSLSISSDGNNKRNALRMSSTSSSTSSKMPQKKVVLWEVFTWILDVERSRKHCLGSFAEVKTTTILNDMDFLLG